MYTNKEILTMILTNLKENHQVDEIDIEYLNLIYYNTVYNLLLTNNQLVDSQIGFTVTYLGFIDLDNHTLLINNTVDDYFTVKTTNPKILVDINHIDEAVKKAVKESSDLFIEIDFLSLRNYHLFYDPFVTNMIQLSIDDGSDISTNDIDALINNGVHFTVEIINASPLLHSLFTYEQ